MTFQFIPPETVEVPEIELKKRIDLEPQSTALLIVDMQNDFVNEEGNLHVPAAQQSVAKIQKLLQSARSAGVKIAYTQDTHFEGDREWQIWPEHCREGTWGWQIIDELKPQANELVCQKCRYDGFYGTWLEHYLTRIWKVDNLVIVGTMSNICVVQTAGSAGLRWLNIVVPADGISANTEFDQALALRQVSFLYAGELVKSVDDIRFSSTRA